MRKKVKTLTWRILLEFINDELKNLNIKDLYSSFYPIKLFKINKEQAYITEKKFNLDLLNKSFRSIFSVSISGRSNKEKNFNKNLINKIYEIHNYGNLEYMKLKDFFDYLKNLIDNNKLEDEKDGIDDKGIIKEIADKLDKYFNENKDSQDYNKNLKEMIKNYPLIIKNMKEKKEEKK